MARDPNVRPLLTEFRQVGGFWFHLHGSQDPACSRCQDRIISPITPGLPTEVIFEDYLNPAFVGFTWREWIAFREGLKNQYEAEPEYEGGVEEYIRKTLPPRAAQGQS